ncbi:filaggrin [Solea solea]|uniref:filaggrin n=1 Tax=Solea solea TaxID=90069 RepID=UPI002729F1DB|nr:filaggrin [Solea solea]
MQKSTIWDSEIYQIDNVQSLLQCPGILVCVGREPSHPSIVENFWRTSGDKLSKFNLRSPSSGCTDGQEGLRTQKSVINPKFECDNSSNRHSVSSDKSLPDGTDSPDNVDSCSPTGDGLRHDDVEKKVHVNKDGSLSMEMKVHFRLQNDETLQWSTKVKKMTGRTCEQRHNNTYLLNRFEQVSERSYSKCENISTGEQDESYINGCNERHVEELHCPHCCSHQQDYDVCKNIPGTHGASRHIQTSSSSASSHAVVSRKIVTERHIVSRSSEEHVEQVEEETCIKQTETEEYCTIRRDTCSPKCNLQSTITDNCKACVDGSTDDHIQTSEPEEQAGSARSASSQILSDHEGDQKDEDASRGSSQNGRPEREESTESAMQQKSPSLTDRTSNSSVHSTKSRKSKASHTCHCGESNVSENNNKGQTKAQDGEESEIQTDQSSAMPAESNASGTSNESEAILNTGSGDIEEKRSKSAMSVQSNASNVSAKSKTSGTSEVTPQEDSEDKSGETQDIDENVNEQEEAEEVGEDQDRVPSVMSQKSSKSKYSEMEDPQNIEEVQIADGETRIALSATSSNKAENDEDVMDNVYRSPSTMSVKSTKSTRSRRSRTSESLKSAIHDEIQAENEERQSERSLSPRPARSVKSNVSATSKKSSNLNTEDVEGPPVRAISAMSAKSNVSAGRPQSTMSVKSSKSVKSNISTKSGKSKHSNVTNKDSDDSHDDKDDTKETEARAASCISKADESPNSCTSANKSLDTNDDAEERATSVKSEMSGISKSSAISSKSKASREASTMSAKSAKSNTTAVSTNSNIKCNGDICDEGNDAERSPSRTSGKSAKSNISARSTHSKSCGGSDSAKNGEERGPSVLSVKSAKSVVSVKSSKSTRSHISAKSNMSEANGVSAEENTADKEHGQRAPSNMSTLSAKSLKSNASAISKKSIASSVKSGECSAQGSPEGDDDEGNDNEVEEAVARTESSLSAISVHSHVSEKSLNFAERAPSAFSAKSAKSHISSKSKKSTHSAKTSDTPGARYGGEETRECTASQEQDVPAEGNTSVHDEHVERAPSHISIKSAKSGKSNVSKSSKKSKKSVPPQENSAVYEERPSSAVSDRSLQSNTSTKSERSERIFPHEGNIEVENAERAPSCMSAKSTRSNFTVKSVTFRENIANGEDMVKRVPSAMSAKSDTSGMCAQIIISADNNDEEESGERPTSTLSAKSNISVSSKSTTAYEVLATDNAADEEESVQRPVSTLSAKSGRSVKSTQSDMSKKSKSSHSKTSIASIKSAKSGQSCITGASKKPKASENPAEDDAHITDTEEHTDMAAKSSVSAKSVKSNVTSISTRSKASHSPDKVNNEEHAASNSENAVVCEDTEQRAQSAMSLKSNKLLPPNISVIESCDITDERNEEEKSKRATSVKSGKSTVSERSKKSAACEAGHNKSETQSQSSLFVKSNLSMKSHKSKPRDILSDKDVQKKEEGKMPTASNEPTSSLLEEDKHKDNNDKSCHSKTSKSSRQGKKTEVIASARQSKGNKHVISHTESTESDLSQTLSSSDNVKDAHETAVTRESNTSVSNVLTEGRLEATNIDQSVADNQSDKSSKCKQKNMEADDFELVPSSLPNASPTEVVNEWLKTITTHGDVYDPEELSENYEGQKNDLRGTGDIDRTVDNESNPLSPDDNPKYVNDGVVMNSVPNNNCQTNAEALNADSAPSDDTSKVFHSSVHVMKVLLNTKVDRCNSLPEISPVYGRKLSTSARGLLDCLVKLQLINHDAKNADEKNRRYQELMDILKSLWLCDPPENEHVTTKKLAPRALARAVMV